jgi:hypothetical protein
MRSPYTPPRQRSRPKATAVWDGSARAGPVVCGFGRPDGRLRRDPGGDTSGARPAGTASYSRYALYSAVPYFFRQPPNNHVA